MTASCSRYNNTTYCEIISPIILRQGWEIIGWNNKPNETISSWIGKLSNSDLFYAITNRKYEPGSLVFEIFANNIEKANADFNVTADSENREEQEGLFFIIENLQDTESKIYYFRGTHELNNNVIWAGYQWKILRVGSDGTVRMIYNGKCTLNIEETNCTQGIYGNNGGSNTSINYSQFNSFTDRDKLTDSWDNRFVGYMYGNTCISYETCHANEIDSTIKKSLENWYNNDENISVVAKAQTVLTAYCNDRQSWTNVTGTSNKNYISSGIANAYFGPRIRLQRYKTPDVTCELNDTFLTNVGLITADEIAMAGGVYEVTNEDYFLRTNQAYWTMSPRHYTDGARLFFVDTAGNLNSNWVEKSYGIRPVVTLNSNVNISRGNGSSAEPFILQS